MGDYTTIRYASDGPVAMLTFNRPEAFNGITNTMMRGCTSAFPQRRSTRRCWCWW
jgi:enoyl-CoA hydratase/carnithine racemase